MRDGKPWSHALTAAKILPLHDLARELEAAGRAGRKIVQCHGCFDLLHIGHIRHLQAARAMGDVLVVTVTADEIGRASCRERVSIDV